MQLEITPISYLSGSCNQQYKREDWPKLWGERLIIRDDVRDYVITQTWQEQYFPPMQTSLTAAVVQKLRNKTKEVIYIAVVFCFQADRPLGSVLPGQIPANMSELSRCSCVS
jgi:hypothetical protein